MRKFIYIDENNRTKEVVYSETKEFPNMKLEKLYPDYFIKRCVEVDLDFEYKEGMDYNWETQEFSEHIEYFPEEEEHGEEIGIEGTENTSSN